MSVSHQHDEAHDEAHDHGSGDHRHAGHGHAPASFDRAFVVGIVLNLIIVATQAGFGLIANSLALLSDAAHNLSDVLSLVLAFVGAVLARRPPSVRFTYGLRKASILAALANAALLLIAIGGITVEAVQRLANPAPVASGIVMWVAAVGIVGNAATALMFSGGHGDINIRGAFVHMVADAAVSFGVLVGAGAIMLTGWFWLDPAISLAIAAFLLWMTWDLAKDTVGMALDGVPRGVDRSAITEYLKGIDGVREVHDLHIWPLSTTETALTVHLVRPEGALDDKSLDSITRSLQQRFKIHHATIQIEQGDPAHPCVVAPQEVV